MKDQLEQRDLEIYGRWLSGESTVKIAKHYSISPPRVSQICHRVRDYAEEPTKRLIHKDQSTALWGTWIQTVLLLMPHIEAIKAIAEEKNT